MAEDEEKRRLMKEKMAKERAEEKARLEKERLEKEKNEKKVVKGGKDKGKTGERLVIAELVAVVLC